MAKKAKEGGGQKREKKDAEQWKEKGMLMASSQRRRRSHYRCRRGEILSYARNEFSLNNIEKNWKFFKNTIAGFKTPLRSRKKNKKCGGSPLLPLQ